MWNASSHDVRSALVDSSRRPRFCVGSTLMPHGRRRHVGGYPGTKRAAGTASINPGARSPSYIASQRVTLCEGGCWFAGGSRSNIWEIFWALCLVRLAPNPLALWPIEPTILRTESNLRLVKWSLARKDRRLSRKIAAPPPFLSLELQRRSRACPA